MLMRKRLVATLLVATRCSFQKPILRTEHFESCLEGTGTEHTVPLPQDVSLII